MALDGNSCSETSVASSHARPDRGTDPVRADRPYHSSSVCGTSSIRAVLARVVPPLDRILEVCGDGRPGDHPIPPHLDGGDRAPPTEAAQEAGTQSASG